MNLASLSSAVVKNERRCTSASPIRLYGVDGANMTSLLLSLATGAMYRPTQV